MSPQNAAATPSKSLSQDLDKDMTKLILQTGLTLGLYDSKLFTNRIERLKYDSTVAAEISSVRQNDSETTKWEKS